MPQAPNGLVLASASPRRRELLAAVGLAFTVQPADLDETALAGDLSPADAALAIARAKAAAVERARAVTLAADTVVVLDEAMLGKPTSAAEAREMLAALRGRMHEVITAIAVRDDGGERAIVCHSEVRMRAYSTEEIARYVAEGGGLDKAGAYGIQDEPFRPVEAIHGCWCNVMGLPLWPAVRFLADAGYAPARDPAQAFARCAACPLAHTDVLF